MRMLKKVSLVDSKNKTPNCFSMKYVCFVMIGVLIGGDLVDDPLMNNALIFGVLMNGVKSDALMSGLLMGVPLVDLVHIHIYVTCLYSVP